MSSRDQCARPCSRCLSVLRFADLMCSPLPGCPHLTKGPQERSASCPGAGERLRHCVVTGFTPPPNIHTVPPTAASCHHADHVTQCQGILTWCSKMAEGSLMVSFILKPSQAVSAGWWQMLVHTPHFTWAFMFAEGITPMGKRGNLPLENWPRS